METQSYFVVRNHEHQYSIWFADKAVPAGWDVQYGPAEREACLEYVRTHWTDITPLSVRNARTA